MAAQPDQAAAPPAPEVPAVAAPPAAAPEAEADADKGANADGADDKLLECPICFDMKPDVCMLVHRSREDAAAEGKDKKYGDVSEHRACGDCQAHMVANNQSCPWCRDEVVWQELFGFLDALKSATVAANEPQALAALMMKWQEYEMMRSQSDVIKFANEMVTDEVLFAHLEKATADQPAFIRDSSGIWVRFYGMMADGDLKLDKKYSDLLNKAVDGFITKFEADGGTAPAYGGAVYTQVCVAMCCTFHSSLSAKAIIPVVQRVGKALCKFYRKRYNEIGQSLLPRYIAEAVSEAVYGSVDDDPVMQDFFINPYKPGAPEPAPPAAAEPEEAEEDEEDEEVEELDGEDEGEGEGDGEEEAAQAAAQAAAVVELIAQAEQLAVEDDEEMEHVD